VEPARAVRFKSSQVVHDRPTPHQRSCRSCGSSPSPTGPLTTSCPALAGPPGSRAWSFHACGGLRPRRVRAMLALAHLSVLPSARGDGVGTPGFQEFRGSIPRLHVPLSTLRAQPYDCPRMTRGRCGSLGLHRATLSFATPRRLLRRTSMLPSDPTSRFGPCASLPFTSISLGRGFHPQAAGHARRTTGRRVTSVTARRVRALAV
jgi:hypothetical protein